MKLYLTLLLCSLPALSQEPLPLKEAVRLALEKHPAMEASAARIKAAESRVEQARSGKLPHVNYTESWARSNNPVFVFGSLLTQHQFTEKNFAIGPLNRPDFLNNFQSQVTVDQMIYDARQSKSQIQSAGLGKSIANEDSRLTAQNLIANVVRFYYGSVLAAESLKVAKEAVRSAEADRQRATSVLAAGMSTEADVLSIQVHLAAMREQEIRRAQELEVALASLNDALGLPLDTKRDLTTPLTSAASSAAPAVDLAKNALEQRPEARQLRLATQLAETQVDAARGAMLPQVFVRAAFEADRERFVTRGGANWLVSAGVKWNLFNGFADRARIAEATESAHATRAQGRQLTSGIELQLKNAQAHATSAKQRIEVARATVTMAEESLRITKNRFESGLATVTDLLRTETALLETKTRLLAAVYDERLAATALELAAGALTPDSQVLN